MREDILVSRTNRHEEPAAASREDLESAVATGDPTSISRTMVGVIEDDDVDWLTDTLLDLAGHESLEVRATAVTCLGHVARIHGHVDSDRVLSRLRHLRSERPLRGRVDDAIDDIKHFAVHRSHALVTELVNDLEEDLRADGILCLYQFSWFQDIGRRPQDRSEIERLSRAAYDELVRRHPNLRLVWVTWPDVAPSAAKPAAAETELDFFLESDEQGTDPLLAVVL
jgi:hypothetical protein